VVVLAGACMPLAADSVVVSPSCDQVPKVENAFLKFTSQDSAVVDCHRGFVLHGSDDMTCTDGTWSAAPACISQGGTNGDDHTALSPCGKPASVINGTIVMTAQGLDAYVVCNDGSFVDGSVHLNCFEKKWVSPANVLTATCRQQRLADTQDANLMKDKLFSQIMLPAVSFYPKSLLDTQCNGHRSCTACASTAGCGWCSSTQSCQMSLKATCSFMWTQSMNTCPTGASRLALAVMANNNALALMGMIMVGVLLVMTANRGNGGSHKYTRANRSPRRTQKSKKDAAAEFDAIEMMETGDSKLTSKELTNMITELGKAGKWEDAVRVLDSMVREGRVKPNNFHFCAAISACGRAKQCDKAMALFEQMQQLNVKPDEFTCTAAISACEKGKKWETAVALLQRMHSKYGQRPSVHAYSAAISACEKGGQCEKALELLDEMPDKGLEPNEYAYSAAIAACATVGMHEKAAHLLDAMQAANVKPNVFSYGSAVKACAEAGEWQKALSLIARMEASGVKANVVVYNAALSACAKGGSSDKVSYIFGMMKTNGVRPNVTTYNSGISAFAAANKSNNAIAMLRAMRKQGVVPDVISYNAAIAACEKRASWEQAVDLLAEITEMKLVPTVVSYSTAISCCGKAGQHAKAFEILASMTKHRVDPNIYAYSPCIVACYKGDDLDLACKVRDMMAANDIEANETCLAAVEWCNTQRPC
jgi:pentatricopeptide repeat domain-containing protein 1